MKKIKYILLVAFAISLSSCGEDYLDEKPGTGIEVPAGQNPIKDEATMKNLVTGMYNQFKSADAFGSTILNVGNLVSDDVFVSVSNSGYYRTTDMMTWTPSGSDFTQYNKLYDAIGLSNFVLNAKIEETANVKNYKAQAYTARALALFYLVNFYSANPTSGLNQNLGIPVYTGEFDQFGKYPRKTVNEVYDQIISDLNAATASTFAGANKGYFSTTAAQLILAKVYLTRGQSGDYQKAIEHADKALAAGGATNLIKKDKLVNYFYPTLKTDNDNQGETVWELNMSEKSNLGVNVSMGVLYDPSSSRRSQYVRASLYDKYDATDIRKSLFTKSTVTADSPTGYAIKKYKWTVSDQGVNKPNVANIRIFRLTDALFVKWEAMAKSGQGAAVLTEVNAFAAERGATTTYTGDALTAVLNEKRKEFVGEGQRYFDLKRNNLDLVKGTNCSGANCTVSATNKLFVLPIPTSSTDINTEMVQYPGWEN